MIKGYFKSEMCKFTRNFFLFCAIINTFTSAAHAQSWNTTSGIITNIALSYETNYAFRITLSKNGANPLISCKFGFAYINKITSENYEAKVAALLTAYSQGKMITIYYLIEQDQACRLTDFGF